MPMRLYLPGRGSVSHSGNLSKAGMLTGSRDGGTFCRVLVHGSDDLLVDLALDSAAGLPRARASLDRRSHRTGSPAPQGHRPFGRAAARWGLRGRAR